jgi:MFS family permease
MIVGLLTAAYAVSILDRTIISLLVQPITHDLHISDSQFGLLQGLAFSILYSVIGLPMGMLADLWDRRLTIIIGLVLWSSATLGCGFANSFSALFAARAAVGIGEACLMPVAASLIADLFAPDRRAKAYGVFVGGSTIGSGLALILGGLAIKLAAHLVTTAQAVFGGFAPWHVVFFLTGAPGLLIALVMALLLREPARKAIKAAEADGEGSLSTFAFLKSSWRAHGALIGGAALNLACVYAIIAWFPALFMRVHGWSAATTGQVLGWLSLPIGLFTAINSGWVMAWLAKRGHSDAPMLVAATTALAFATFGVGACLLPSGAWAIVGYVAITLVVNWNSVAAIAGLAQITPSRLRARVVSVYNLIIGVFSMSLGAFAVGQLSDTVFKGPKGISASLAAAFLGFSLPALAVLLAGRGAYRKALARNALRAG